MFCEKKFGLHVQMTFNGHFWGTDLTLIPSNGDENWTQDFPCPKKLFGMIFVDNFYVRNFQVVPHAPEQHHGHHEVQWPQIIKS